MYLGIIYITTKTELINNYRTILFTGHGVCLIYRTTAVGCSNLFYIYFMIIYYITCGYGVGNITNIVRIRFFFIFFGSRVTTANIVNITCFLVNIHHTYRIIVKYYTLYVSIVYKCDRILPRNTI